LVIQCIVEVVLLHQQHLRQSMEEQLRRKRNH
jgi:hypothetical protein